mgnify:CR=1 FL=1
MQASYFTPLNNITNKNFYYSGFAKIFSTQVYKVLIRIIPSEPWIQTISVI